MAGVVLANGSLSGQQSGEGEIRQKMVEDDLVECIVKRPPNLRVYFVYSDISFGLCQD